MARIKLGPMVTDIAGSIGGVTIQRNKFGITMRQRPFPPASFTPAQYNVRQKIITIQQAWQNLTDAQRLQWDRFLDYSGQTIKADKSVKLSGHALYLKYQILRLLSGYSLLTTITYIPMPTVPVFNQITLGASVYQIIFDDPVDYSDHFFLFKITTPRNENRAFSMRGLRFMKVTPADSSTFEFQNSYIASFGILPLPPFFVHYSIQWFSALAPIYSGITTSVTAVAG